MFWLILAGSVLGVIFGLVILILIIGRFLPERYQGRIEMTFRRPPEDIWAAMNDYHSHPLTGSMMKRIEEIPSQNSLPAWIEDIGSSKIAVTTVASESPSFLVRELRDLIVPMTSCIEVQFEPLANGCKVIARNEIWVRRGTWHVPIFRFMLTVTKGARRSLIHYWQGIAKELGESIEIQ